jgi:hypothetical protein
MYVFPFTLGLSIVHNKKLGLVLSLPNGVTPFGEFQENFMEFSFSLG